MQSPANSREKVSAVGVDGCRAGWIGAVAVDDSAKPRTALHLFDDAGGLLRWRDQQPAAPVVALDVPMGLPPVVGLRECDREARNRLGRRWMCVFEPPDRELFGHDFEVARAIVYSRRAADPLAAFHVLTQQGVHILNKIAEVDEVLCEDPSRQEWLIEVHPEVCFRELEGGDLPRKKSSAGKKRRLDLLRGHFPDIEERLNGASCGAVMLVTTTCSMRTQPFGARCVTAKGPTTTSS